MGCWGMEEGEMVREEEEGAGTALKLMKVKENSLCHCCIQGRGPIGARGVVGAWRRGTLCGRRRLAPSPTACSAPPPIGDQVGPSVELPQSPPHQAGLPEHDQLLQHTQSTRHGSGQHQGLGSSSTSAASSTSSSGSLSAPARPPSPAWRCSPPPSAGQTPSGLSAPPDRY